MIAKIRMQVGDAVISWGALPEPLSANGKKIDRRVRPRFAVIDGGRQVVANETGALLRRARSA